MDTAEARSRTDRVGTLVAGRYTLHRLVGEGGMGAVYEAEHGWTQRRVAVKILRPQFTENREAVQRFFQEARVSSAIRHPNIVDVIDMGEDESTGELFIVQELLAGEDLEQRLARTGPLTEAQALEIYTALLRALAESHRAGIVHRDLKPANIFLAAMPDGTVQPKLIDFGISKVAHRETGLSHTRTGVLVGTPAYMSPEQARGDTALDGRSDLWSLGVVLYEMVSGRRPYEADTYNVLVADLLYRDPVDIADVKVDVGSSVARVLRRVLQRSPGDRYASADEALADVLTAEASVTAAMPDVLASGVRANSDASGAFVGRRTRTAVKSHGRHVLLATAVTLVTIAVLLPFVHARRFFDANAIHTVDAAPVVTHAAPAPQPEAPAATPPAAVDRLQSATPITLPVVSPPASRHDHGGGPVHHAWRRRR